MYADGAFNNQEVVAAGAVDTACDTPIVIGGQNRSDGQFTRLLNGSIARVRVHSAVVSDPEVAANSAPESADFGQ